jgi:hypothetical protein
VHTSACESPSGKAAAKRLGKSRTVVDYKEYAGRPHCTAGPPGWEAVADYALEWTSRHIGARATMEEWGKA